MSASRGDPTRRDFIKAGAGVVAGAALPRRPRARGRATSVAVIGAGAFGGWTAFHLLDRGADVTLIDAWGPGNSRSSSGGETRMIRGTYGSARHSVVSAARAFQLWREAELRWDERLLRPVGALRLRADDSYGRVVFPLLDEFGFPYEELTPADVRRRFPQFLVDDVGWAMFEPEAGYLRARHACQVVARGIEQAGGRVQQGLVQSVEERSGEVVGLRLAGGSRITADCYVFACGPWIGELFPDLFGPLIRPNRQEVFFYGPPGGDPSFFEDAMPAWLDALVPTFFYGFPSTAQTRGVKIAGGHPNGPTMDPTQDHRMVTTDRRAAARSYLEHRFPAMRDAPLVETRVCQYSSAPDGEFILDRHPSVSNAWVAAGGSGHGFKHGPTVGETMASMVLEGTRPAPVYSLARLED